MLSSIDHVVIAVADLVAATRDYTSLLGCEPSWEGAHPGMGTRNTLFRLPNTYVELLAADGNGTLGAMVRDALGGRDERPFALALGVSEIDVTVPALRAAGFAVMDPMDGSGRDERSGTVRSWRSAFIDTGATRGLRLFVIQHTSSPDLLPLARSTAEPSTVAAGVDHVVIFTQDLEGSHMMWQRLGVAEIWRQEFPQRGTRNLGLDLGGITIELIMRVDRAPTDKPDTLWGIAYKVGDCARSVQRARAGAIAIDDPRPGLAPGTMVSTVRWTRTATLLVER